MRRCYSLPVEYSLRVSVYQPRRMLAMSGILRQLMCFCFLGLMVGSLWLFAASANTPSIPPWRAEEEKALSVERPQHQQTAAIAEAGPRVLDCDLDDDVDQQTAMSAASAT